MPNVPLDDLVELASESRFQTVFDHLAVGSTITAPDGRLLRVNSALTELLGYEESELLGRTFQSLTHPDDLAANTLELHRALAGEIDRYRLEKRFIHARGHAIWVQLTTSVIRDANGEARYFVSQYEDLTERRAAQARLAESEARYRTLVEAAHEGICTVDPIGRITYANRQLATMLGYERDELVGKSLFDFMDPQMAFEARTRFARRQRGIAERGETTFVRKDGALLWTLNSASSLFAADGHFRGAVYLVTDMTERNRAHAALRESEARFQNIVNNVPGMVYQWMYQPDWTGAYTYVSEGSRTLFGIAPEEALRDPGALLGLLPPPDRDVLRERARDAATRLVPFRWEGRAVLATGEERIIQIAAHDQRLADGTVLSDGLVMDVTELRVLEQQLRQAQKMEAVGQLAGGIAHDFNNLLTIISTYTAMAIEALAPDASAVASDLAEVRTAADRAAELTRQLLAFGRKQMLQPQRLDTNATVTEVATMLRRVIGEDITFQLELGRDLWPVLADPGQLSQVLMNLAVNARDAMPNGGTLRLMTANTTIAPMEAHDGSGLTSGEYVMIVVEDSGTGIDSAVLPHIFEPFFTTKETGRGTGLGLATVYGIVKQSGGYVSAESSPGAGARFTVLLPRADGRPSEQRVPSTRTLRGGTETILLVEDESAVRRAVRRMLQSLGYTVLEAESAAAAINLATLADAGATRVDLVLTDVVMPDEGGRALGERLAMLWPGIPIVYMSGYTDDEIFRRGLEHARFIEKPFTAERLATALRDALEATRD